MPVTTDPTASPPCPRQIPHSTSATCHLPDPRLQCARTTPGASTPHHIHLEKTTVRRNRPCHVTTPKPRISRVSSSARRAGANPPDVNSTSTVIVTNALAQSRSPGLPIGRVRIHPTRKIMPAQHAPMPRLNLGDLWGVQAATPPMHASGVSPPQNHRTKPRKHGRHARHRILQYSGQSPLQGANEPRVPPQSNAVERLTVTTPALAHV